VDALTAGPDPTRGGARVADLAPLLRGQLLEPTSPGYDQARLVWNGVIDRRPLAIARCHDVLDVIAAVTFAGERDLPIAVRGGGHNVAGDAVVDDGLVIDLTDLAAVTFDARSGLVTVGGGATIGAVDRVTQTFGRAVPLGVVSATGIAGLTLSGGIGWLRRRFGTSSDALVSAEVVTAEAEVVHASADGDPELLWALRGGGGNFGAVTAFTYRTAPVGPEVFMVVVFYAGDDAVDVLRAFRSWAADAPDAVSTMAVLWHGPEMDDLPAAHRGQPVLTLVGVHCGDPFEGETELRALRELGTPIADLSGVTTYLEVQRFFDEDYPDHARYYWKSLYLDVLGDDLVADLVARNAASPTPETTIDVWQLGGALDRDRPGVGAGARITAPYLLGIEANWQDPAMDAAAIAWARDVHAAAQRSSSGTEYLNFPGFLEGGTATLRRAFGRDYDRLVAVKDRYDPANRFRSNANIPPSGRAG
jgi:FAD/FMN-containing dehydrogenase